MTARTKPLKVIPAAGSALTSTDKYSLPPAKGTCKMISADEAEKLIDLLRTEAKVL